MDSGASVAEDAAEKKEDKPRQKRGKLPAGKAKAGKDKNGSKRGKEHKENGNPKSVGGEKVKNPESKK
jgi:DNA replication initiation complex subunit (GINS family)